MWWKICFNPFTQCYNSPRRGGGMLVPNCLHGRRDSAHKKCIYHFTPLAQRTVGDLVLKLTVFGCWHCHILSRNVIGLCYCCYGDSLWFSFLVDILVFVSNMVNIETTETFCWSKNWKRRTTLSFLSSDTNQMCSETKHKLAFIATVVKSCTFFPPFRRSVPAGILVITCVWVETFLSLTTSLLSLLILFSKMISGRPLHFQLQFM